MSTETITEPAETHRQHAITAIVQETAQTLDDLLFDLANRAKHEQPSVITEERRKTLTETTAALRSIGLNTDYDLTGVPRLPTDSNALSNLLMVLAGEHQRAVLHTITGSKAIGEDGFSEDDGIPLAWIAEEAHLPEDDNTSNISALSALRALSRVGLCYTRGPNQDALWWPTDDALAWAAFLNGACLQDAF